MYYEELTRKGGLGGMSFAALGGVLAIVVTFVFIYISGDSYMWFDEGFVGISDILDLSVGGNYVYLWLLPVFGILTIVLGLVGYLLQKKEVAYAIPIFGFVLLILPLLFIFQFSNDFNMSAVEVFYDTANVGSANVMWLFLGGVLCWIAAGLVLLGGKSLISNINPEYVGKGPTLEEAIKAKEMADPDYFDKEQVEKLRQDRIAARERKKMEKVLADEAKEKSVICSIHMDVPASISIGETVTISVKIRNDGGENVKNLEFDLDDLEHYFDVQGGIKFANVGPGIEMVGSVKIKPKEDEEGIYPILVEITEDGRLIEKRFSIRVEGKESY
jgi:hypothetical protein